MKLPKVKSAPTLFVHALLKDTSSTLRKSASYQFLSEISQLEVEDLKSTKTFIADLGITPNEVVQSTIDLIEGDDGDRIRSVKPVYVGLRLIIRLMIGDFVHFLHHLLIMFWNNFIYYFHH
tara:strand:- start:6251 stop:6613 length:363 start_codon:yes stop_codon:yes gene_type:complete